MNKFFATPVLAIALMLGVTGCGERPAEAQKRTVLKIESAAQPVQMPSGRDEAPLIDAAKKSVTILAPPSAPQRIEQRRRALASEHERREQRIHDLMGRYTDSLDSPAGKSRYKEQLARELDAYKQQTMELHKLQRGSAVASVSPAVANSVE